MVMITRSKRAVSELYASVMMIGVTLVFGSFVATAAINQFNLSTYSGSLAASVQQASVGKQISYIYLAITPGSGSCTGTYQGVTEGKTSILALYNYGSVGMNPTEMLINGTLQYSGTGLGNIAPGSMTTFSLTLAACAHPTGQTILLVDASGDEVQFGT
jgi:FlaG/FlaF family flagellin (archaellin)